MPTDLHFWITAAGAFFYGVSVYNAIDAWLAKDYARAAMWLGAANLFHL